MSALPSTAPTTETSKVLKNLGEEAWKAPRNEKINAELFTLTYGSLVVQLVKDLEDYQEVNRQLERMGFNIGTRLVEDFSARTGIGRCVDFAQTGETVAKVGFKLFLNITPNVVHRQSSASSGAASGPNEFSLILDENPLSDFVELPSDALRGGLWYSNVLCGVIRGALEMVQMQTDVQFVSDQLRGDESTEIRVRLLRYLDEEAPPADD